MARFLKAFLKCLAGVALVIAIPALIYKSLDEKLTPEAAKLFETDLETKNHLSATAQLLFRFPKINRDDMPSGLCAPKDPPLTQEKWAEFKEKNPELIQLAYKIVELPALALSQNDISANGDHISKLRNVFVILENDSCANSNSSQRKWEILNQMASQSLQTVQTENVGLTRFIFFGIFRSSLEKIIALEKKDKKLAAKSNLAKYKSEMLSINPEEFYRSTVKAEAKTVYNSFRADFDPTDYDWLDAFFFKITHWNKAKNNLVKSYPTMGGDELLKDKNPETLYNSGFRIHKSVNEMIAFRLCRQKSKLIQNIELAKQILTL